MDESKWISVDEYLESQLPPADPALEFALRSSADAGLPSIQVSPLQGRLLYLIARLRRPRRILEVGTLGGYSTIWLARALEPGGRLLSLEVSPRHAEVARANLERAGVGSRVEVRVGTALETLPRLLGDPAGPFDLVFLDADKENTAAYFDWAVRLASTGAVIVVDNVVRAGGILDASGQDPSVVGMRRFLEVVARDPRVEATVIQTVGSKGWDGFALARVR
jgi:predicted O-methyltransferase YrrM